MRNRSAVLTGKSGLNTGMNTGTCFVPHGLGLNSYMYKFIVETELSSTIGLSNCFVMISGIHFKTFWYLHKSMLRRKSVANQCTGRKIAAVSGGVYFYRLHSYFLKISLQRTTVSFLLLHIYIIFERVSIIKV